MKIHRFILYLFLSFGLMTSSCDKNKKCSKNPEEIPINVEKQTVVVGWPIKLSAYGGDTYDQYDYHWKGPQVDLLKGKYDDQPSIYVKESADLSDAGTYFVEIIDGNCVKKRGTVEITVIDPPSEPCTLQNNYVTNTIILGVGGTYSSIQEYTQFPPVYFIEATKGSNTALTFRFNNGGSQPKLGVYKSNGQLSPDGENQEELSVKIHSGFYDFVMKPGFNVYVTRVNGKLHLAFCDAEFDNPITSDPLVISGSITLP